MVSSLILVVSLTVADHYYWKALRPLSALGAFYGVMMAFDYLKACNYGLKIEVGVNDAKIISKRVNRKAQPRNGGSAESGQGSIAELVRIYGRSRRP